jgi:hypothetical protein
MEQSCSINVQIANTPNYIIGKVLTVLDSPIPKTSSYSRKRQYLLVFGFISVDSGLFLI